jgi:hypothetical protein
MLSDVMVGVAMLSVILLNVVAPLNLHTPRESKVMSQGKLDIIIF